MTAIASLFRALLVVGLVSTLALTGCSDPSENEPAWAIVKVELRPEQPPLRSICIGDACKEFELEDAVRSAEFSAFVTRGERYEIRTNSPDLSATGTAPAGGCVLLKDGLGLVVQGCGA